MHARKGFSLTDLLIIIALIGILAALLLPALASVKEKANQSKCKANLKMLGAGMMMYLDALGRGFAYPPKNGSFFLCMLYIKDILAEGNVFLCPSTSDNNQNGRMITRQYGHVQGQQPDTMNVCSYAGRKNANQKKYPGIFTFRNAAQMPMGCDDWGVGQGSLPYNHPDVVIFLYIDGHVQSISQRYSSLKRLTDPLAN